MPKTVWYISKYANILKYGADTRQASFCRQFKLAGYQVKLIASNSSHLFDSLPKFKGRYLEESDEGLDMVWVNTPKYKGASSVQRILSWFWFELFVILFPFLTKTQKPDVVIASSLSLLSVFSGCFFKFFYKAKFIFEVRDIWPQSIIDIKNVSTHHPLVIFLRFIEKIGYKYSDEIVGTMPGLKMHVEDVIGKNEKVYFIPQGVSLDFYEFEQQEVSSSYLEKYLPKNKFIVAYAGTLGVANALNYIIDTAKIVDRKNSNIHFLFIGSGSEEENLKKQASSLNNVTFAPRVEKTQIQSILCHADILIASVKKENVYQFGISLNKFIDYMFAKKPIICMFSGYPSMINEANCGEFIPAEDPRALVEAIFRYKDLSKADLDTLGQNGYDFLINKRNINELSRQYMELL